MAEEDTFKDILSTLASVFSVQQFNYQQRIPWTVVYNVNLKVPDIIIFKNGSPDSCQNEKINRRDDNLLNLETVKNYFLKNAFDDQSVIILRQKAKDQSQGDSKEYLVLDDNFVKTQFSTSVSQDLKAQWEAAFTYLPFKQCGGIFKVTYERQSESKTTVHALKRNIQFGRRNSEQDEDNSNSDMLNNAAGAYSNKGTRNDNGEFMTDSPKHQSGNKFYSVNSGNKRSTQISQSSQRQPEKKNDLAKTNIFTSKGTLLTFKGRESGVQSTFNQQWKEIIQRFIQIVELLTSVTIYQLSIDVMIDDLGNRKCACKTFCHYAIDVKTLIDDDDDLLQFNRDRDVFLGWINFAEQEIQNQKTSTTHKPNCFILPLKSILLEKHERYNYLKSIDRIKDDQAGQGSKYQRPKEFDINTLDGLVNINEFEDPLLLYQRACNFQSQNQTLIDLTMSSLMGLDRYQHLRAASLYEQVKICKNCFLSLTKIEFHRRKHYLREERNLMNNNKQNDSSYEEIEDDSLDLKYLPNKEIKKKKQKYIVMNAHDSHQVIKNRNLKYQQAVKEQTLIVRNQDERSIRQRDGNTGGSRKQSLDVNTFNRLEKTGLLSPANYMLNIRNNPSHIEGIIDEEEQIVLPRIMKDIKTDKIFLTKKESEMMGIKYHLGHTGYLQKNQSEKIFLTKSSISLNKLADLASAAENIEFKLKSIKEDTINQQSLQSDWLKKVDVNFSMLKKVTKKHRQRPTTMSNMNNRKVNIESAPGTLRLFDNNGQVSKFDHIQGSQNQIKISVNSNDHHLHHQIIDNLNINGQPELLNFDEFKSNLDNKMLSFQREQFGRTQLKIAATTNDLPFEKREQIMRKLNVNKGMNGSSIPPTPHSVMSRTGTMYGGFSGALNKGVGDLARSIPQKFTSQRQNYESSKFL
ncbi:UNKNOWN [Stylonychia lemnae]|uniref:Uncharacterized protein n=1 Tax=Stylonychia lemnae TaxID=5949 RepID=A0A078ALW1_STYLE|nr:UNKNOWN [Stylonychia lemnae]|eukprot:CDW82866.1 UNKNOWN [Stylonychia lemnae]